MKSERKDQALVSASRALSEYYHIKPAQYKEMVFEQGQNPGCPLLKEYPQHQDVHVGNPEVLPLSVL